MDLERSIGNNKRLLKRCAEVEEHVRDLLEQFHGQEKDYSVESYNEISEGLDLAFLGLSRACDLISIDIGQKEEMMRKKPA